MEILVALVSRHAAWLAAASVVAAVLVGSGVEGYSHAQHPLALRGAEPLPDATLFNALAFVVPGMLVAWVAVRLRTAMALSVEIIGARRPSWPARLGAQLSLLSALAFAAQGLLPLDANDLDGIRSSRHAAAWMLWWIAFAIGGTMLAAGLRGAGLRASAAWRVLAAGSLAAALFVPLCALLLPHVIPAGIAQRIAFALWLAWAILAGRVPLRAAQP